MLGASQIESRKSPGQEGSPPSCLIAEHPAFAIPAHLSCRNFAKEVCDHQLPLVPLALEEPIESEDAADALAVAICHATRVAVTERLGA